MKPTHLLLAAMLPATLLTALPVIADDAQPVAPAAALTPAQAAEVRALVQEVLADSEKRGTLADGVTAGIDDKGKIFLKSEDSKYDIQLYGRVQTRFSYNNDANRGGQTVAASGGSHNTNANDGFEVRRVNLGWKGHVGDGVAYLVELETRLPGSVSATDIGIALAYTDIEVAEGTTIRAGKMYAPYSRVGFTSPYYQVGIDRSTANNYFTQSKIAGVQLEYTDEYQFRARLAIDDGGNAEGNQWSQSPNQFATHGRIDYLPLGSFADTNDNFALLDADKQTLLFGVAGYWQNGANGGGAALNTGAVPGSNGITYGTPSYNIATGAATTTPIDYSWGATADATWKVANFCFYAAGYVASAHPDNVGPRQIPTPWGLEGQVEYRISRQFDVYTQYNYINPDVTSSYTGGGALANGKPFQEAVLGANYFINSHLKLTGELDWVVCGGNPPTIGSLPAGQALNTGSGTVNNTNATHSAAGQIAARLQLQVNF